MEESLPPSRPAIARSVMNMTTAPTSDIHPYFPNDTHVILQYCYNVSLCDLKYVPCFIVLMRALFISGCNRRELTAP
jgi:hypothetical protein